MPFSSSPSSIFKVPRRGAAAIAVALATIVAGSAAGSAIAEEKAVFSEWAQGHNVRTRVVAGGTSPAHGGKLLAGVEIDMADGWKTYWRNPGDAGGIPPAFDWSRSSNVASVQVLYPAPIRITDAAGTNIGYKGNVVFPVIVEPADASQAVGLKLDFSFGTCREICVPGEAVHELSMPTGKAAASSALDAAMARVPLAEPAAALKGNAPRLEKSEIQLDGKSPRVVLHVAFAGDAAGADVFAEGPVGEYVPMPQLKSEGAGGVRVYEIDLTDGADAAALKGQSLTLTLVSKSGNREVRLALP